MFGSAQTENVAYTILCIILGCLYVPKQYTKACCITFSHATAVLYVPAIEGEGGGRFQGVQKACVDGWFCENDYG